MARNLRKAQRPRSVEENESEGDGKSSRLGHRSVHVLIWYSKATGVLPSKTFFHVFLVGHRKEGQAQERVE